MSVDFISRLVGMIIFALLGILFGYHFGSSSEVNQIPGLALNLLQYTLIFGLVGALFGLGVTPYITTRPARYIRNKLTQISAQSLFSSFIGLIAGLIIATLLAFPLSLLPKPLGMIMPFVGVVLFAYLSITIFSMRSHDFFKLISNISSKGRNALPDKQVDDVDQNWVETRTILLDTSVVIDGRIADIARTGFLPGSLLIPRFILNELQNIADSPDSLRRQRGRRGMEVLANLQKEPNIPIRISDIDVEGVREVDDKLVILARQLRCPVLTNDYNLNRVAELQGVTVLNINELANAVKSVLLPGELMRIRVIQDGKEANQGVGYMDDGTMVVIENGHDYMDREIVVVVTKVLQTAAGRMIFARPEEG